MKTEVPLCKRCCFCVPLRYGLLLWSYLILVPNTLLLLQDIYFLHTLYREYNGVTYWVNDTLCLISSFCKLGNCVFTVLLIIAAHKKSIRLLKIYYVSGLRLVVANSVVLLLDISYDIFAYLGSHSLSSRWYWSNLLIMFLMDIIFIAMQLYIIALVRSEIHKLEDNQEFEFSNMAAAAEQAYYEPETIKIDDENTTKKEALNNDKEIKTVI